MQGRCDMLMAVAGILLVIFVYFFCKMLIGLRIKYSVAKRRANMLMLVSTGGLSTVIAAIDKLL